MRFSFFKTNTARNKKSAYLCDVSPYLQQKPQIGRKFLRHCYSVVFRHTTFRVELLGKFDS